MNRKFHTHAGILGCLVLGLVLAPAQRAAAQEDRDREFALEFKYMQRLQRDFQMPDFAELVLDQIRRRFTEDKYAVQLQALEAGSPRLDGDGSRAPEDQEAGRVVVGG